MASKNNRSFFRIDVMLPCSYRIVSAEKSAEMPLPAVADSSYIEQYFMEDLNELDEKLKDLLNQIGSKSHLLSDALMMLDSKIDFIIQTIDHKQLSRNIPMRMVNISGGGIAFKVTENVELSDKIDILIRPIAEEEPVLVRCSIVKIIPEADGSNTVALEYDYLSEDDRRKLVYFIQSKEIEYANQNRENNT